MAGRCNMNYTKEEAIRIVVHCAEKYRQELERKSLLFLCVDKHMAVSVYEFCFFGYNYQHLTGLKVKRNQKLETDEEKTETSEKEITAIPFYEKCLEHKISPDDFEFAEDGTTMLKLDILPSLITKNLSASMIGDYNSNKPKLYTEKLAGGVKACMGFVSDSASGFYVPNTVLKEDIRDNVNNWLRIIAIFRKPVADKKYAEITYLAKKTDWARVCVPDRFGYLKGILPKE